MIGMAMTRQIQRHDAQPFQPGRQPAEGRRVIQPAMQRNDRLTIVGAVKMRRHLEMRQAQPDFFEQHAHAAPLESSV